MGTRPVQESPDTCPSHLGPLAEARINVAVEREAKRFFQRILDSRKANIAAYEAELKERREVLAVMEAALARRKAGAAAWQADLKKWKPEKTRRTP